MEVDLVVTLELKPTENKVTFGIEFFFGATNDYGEVEGVAPIVAFAPTKFITHFDGAIDLTLFGTTITEDCANLVVVPGMEEGLQLWYNWKQLMSLLPLHVLPSLVDIMEDLRVDVKVEEIEAIFMED